MSLPITVMLFWLAIPGFLTASEAKVPALFSDLDRIIPRASSFVSGDLIAAAWRISHQQNDDIFNMLDQYLSINDELVSQRNMRVIILIRYIFLSKDGFTVNLGRQIPESRGVESLPDYPLLIIEGIPLLLPDDFEIEGKPTSARVILNHYRLVGGRRRPLAPDLAADSAVVCKNALINLTNKNIQNVKIYEAPFNRQLVVTNKEHPQISSDK